MDAVAIAAATADAGKGLACAHGQGIAQPMEDAATPLEDINRHIADAARLARRNPHEITLVAISKNHGPDAILPVLEQGHRIFGENRVQEAQAKWPDLLARFPDAKLHMVGQLQSNKAQDAVELFDCIHSLDRPRLVTALARAMEKAGRRIPCFVQVNIGGEGQKGGCALSDLPDLLARARDADIDLAGLMCVPPAGVEAAPYFALLDKLAAEHGLTGLSMGMSGDFETAIMLGATHIRIGSALFGTRIG